MLKILEKYLSAIVVSLNQMMSTSWKKLCVLLTVTKIHKHCNVAIFKKWKYNFFFWIKIIMHFINEHFSKWQPIWYDKLMIELGNTACIFIKKLLIIQVLLRIKVSHKLGLIEVLCAYNLHYTNTHLFTVFDQGIWQFLEPVMTVEITVPLEFSSVVLGGINKRKAQILGTESNEEFFTIYCEVSYLYIIHIYLCTVR
jgi:hypothetical protein